jgi:hypothetical protein
MTKEMTKEMTTIQLKKEYAQVIHKLLCERMIEIFSPFDNKKGWKPNKEQRLILDAICVYSAQLPYGFAYDDSTFGNKNTSVANELDELK